MSLSIGKRRGLVNCSTTRGVFAILALDQRVSLRKAMNPSQPDEVSYESLVQFKLPIIKHLSPYGSAVLLDPEYGAAQNLAADNMSGSAGLIVALEQSGYTGEKYNRQSQILPGWSVAKAKMLGADGVKLLVYYHPESIHADDQRNLIAQVAAACKEHNMAFFLEPLVYSIDKSQQKLTTLQRQNLIINMAAELSQLGPDVLKIQFPVDVNEQPDEAAWLDACRQVTEVCPIPWVLLSAGVDFDVYLRQVVVACTAGASGVMAGRAVWKEAVDLKDDQLDTFLKQTAKDRLTRLCAVCDGLAKPWQNFYPPTKIGENWYRNDFR